MYFLSSLVMTSFVGTLLWVIEGSVKPVTRKIFSQTWHYYASLIPVVILFAFAMAILMGIGTVSANSYESQVPEEILLNEVNEDHSVVEEKEDNSVSELTIAVDVPFRMKYHDVYDDLDIDIQVGKQLLTGDEASAYLRYRKPN